MGPKEFVGRSLTELMLERLRKFHLAEFMHSRWFEAQKSAILSRIADRPLTFVMDKAYKVGVLN